MNKPTDQSAYDHGMSRRAWAIFTLVFALYLLMQLVRWDRRWLTSDRLLVPAALVIMSLSHVFQLKDNVRRLVEALVWAMVILALTMSLLY